MIRRIKQWLDIWPTTEKALESRSECVQTGRHVYTVKSNTGAVDAIRSEVVQMQRENIIAPDTVTTNTGLLLIAINSCPHPYPKNLFFGENGVVEIVPVSYNVNIADMMDL